MRRKDLLTILVVVVLAGLFSLLIDKLLFSYNTDRDSIKKLTPISSGFEPLDERFFNEQSINPTIRTVIGSADSDSQNAGGDQSSGVTN